MKSCELCGHNREHGWWGVTGISHCSSCHATWAGRKMAHCVVAGGCHRTFSTDNNAERAHAHKSGNGCVSDRTLERRGLVKVSQAHGAMWRGKPRESASVEQPRSKRLLGRRRD